MCIKYYWGVNNIINHYKQDVKNILTFWRSDLEYTLRGYESDARHSGHRTRMNLDTRSTLHVWNVDVAGVVGVAAASFQPAGWGVDDARIQFQEVGPDC